MPQLLLEAKGISHRFDTLLFEEVNFSLAATQSMAIVGRSGSGKSTLLHICSTFIRPDYGKISLLNRELYMQTTHTIENMRRYEIGIIFQFHHLFKGMNAIENIEIATILAKEKIDPVLLEQLEITDVITQKVGELSGGQQQRVSIARVLSKKPRIIFADEPTGNLDDETATLVMDVLIDYTKHNNASLLLVTHDHLLANRCNQIYRLHNQSLHVV
ncbi:MAG: ABC transporter ATP-binding protein [Sulfurovum sp.]|nr:ABC transporter ATP-binding protein [Sulfurovum sp.]MCB4764602.1 ABC transporter ATP-binding protein [Sulfurovum sp.]MCB4778869.1 ABC transporter ATP-binding protein [Sulfurovum sp.]